MDKVKLTTDDKEVKFALEARERLHKSIEKFIEAVETNGLEFTPAFLTQYIKIGIDFIEKQLNIKFEKDFNFLKIVNPTLKANLKAGLNEQVQNINSFGIQVHNELNSLRLDTESISYKGKTPYLTDKDKQEIIDNCTAYLSTEIDKEIFNALNEFGEVFEKVNKILLKNHLPELEEQLTSNSFGYFKNEEGYKTNPWLFSQVNYQTRVDPIKREKMEAILKPLN